MPDDNHELERNRAAREQEVGRTLERQIAKRYSHASDVELDHLVKQAEADSAVQNYVDFDVPLSLDSIFFNLERSPEGQEIAARKAGSTDSDKQSKLFEKLASMSPAARIAYARRHSIGG